MSASVCVSWCLFPGGGGGVLRIRQPSSENWLKRSIWRIRREQLAAANSQGANDTINTCSPGRAFSLCSHPQQQMWVSDPLPPASLYVPPPPLSPPPLGTPHTPHYPQWSSTGSSHGSRAGGVEELRRGRRGRGRGGRGLRFGCFTQKRPVCKELIHSGRGVGGLATTNKRTGLQTKVEGGGRRGGTGGFPAIWSFCFLGGGDGGRRG